MEEKSIVAAILNTTIAALPLIFGFGVVRPVLGPTMHIRDADYWLEFDGDTVGLCGLSKVDTERPFLP